MKIHSKLLRRPYRSVLVKRRCLLVCYLLLFLFITLSVLSAISPLPKSSISSETKSFSLTESILRAGQNLADFSNRHCKEYHSQHGEDKDLFVKYWSRPAAKRDGVFLEIGALDGVALSNSYWYEMCLGWTGVLVEAHPVAAKALRKNRPNAVKVEAAACEKDEGTVEFVGKADGLSGDIDQMSRQFIWDQHRAYRKGEEEVNTVKCRRLSTILREFNVSHIDFWTLDVEGAEWTVLNSFDWDEVAVHVLVIETDKDEKTDYQRRHEFLESKGMMYVGPLYNNELWENPAYLHQLD